MSRSMSMRSHQAEPGSVSGHPSLWRPRACRFVVALGLLLALAAAPAGAQSFGQWWWQASIQLEQLSTETLLGDVQLRRFDQQGLRLDADLNGFILHPLFASFRLHLEMLLEEFEGGRFADADRFGGRVELRFFPRGKYPLRMFFDRRSFQYTLPGDDDPLNLARDADQQQRWGTHVRVTQGALRGVQASFDSATTEFFGDDTPATREENQILRWERNFGRLRHRLRVSRREQFLALVDLDREYLSAFLDEKGAFGEHWEWLLNASSIQQRLTFGDVTRDVDDFRVFGKLYRPLRGRDRLEIDADVDSTRSDFRDPTTRYSLLARYRWQRKPGFQIAPFLRYVQQSADDTSVRSPRAGLSLIWTRTGTLDSVLTFTSSAGSVEENGPSRSSDQSNFDASFTATLGHGSIGRLRKQLEVTLTRNELGTRLDPGFSDDGSSGLPRAVGTQDFLRTRLTLDRRVAQRSSSIRTEWTRLASRDALLGGDFTSNTLSATASHSGRRFTVSANAGETEVQRETLPDQQIDFLVGLVVLRPWRSLDLQASFRQDEQRALFTPDLESRSLEVRVSFRLALLELEGRFFETEQMISGGPLRTNRGFNWSVRRRFGGLLPIFSAPQRRGVIR